MMEGRGRFGMIAAVSLRLLYLIFQQVLGLVLWVPETPHTSSGLLLRRYRRPGMIPRWRCD
jgi:hypothetical protein